MKWSELLQSMDASMFAKLCEQVFAESQRRALEEARSLPPLNETEAVLARNNKIDAIITYSRRVGCSVMIGRAKVEEHRRVHHERAEMAK